MPGPRIRSERITSLFSRFGGPRTAQSCIRERSNRQCAHTRTYWVQALGFRVWLSRMCWTLFLAVHSRVYVLWAFDMKVSGSGIPGLVILKLRGHEANKPCGCPETRIPGSRTDIQAPLSLASSSRRLDPKQLIPNPEPHTALHPCYSATEARKL